MVLALRCFLRISKQTATFAVYVINLLVFITAVKSVYSAVRTGSLYKADFFSSVKVKQDYLHFNSDIEIFYLANVSVTNIK
jgi:hypothetical protein